MCICVVPRPELQRNMLHDEGSTIYVKIKNKKEKETTKLTQMFMLCLLFIHAKE